MRALVVYESMYGNTHVVADHIAAGLAGLGDVGVVPVAAAHGDVLREVDLLIVGGPTHIHGVSTTRSRQAAAEAAAKPDSGLHMETDAEGPGLRDWFDNLEVPASTKAAAFDTRMHGPSILTGRASRGIARRLSERGLEVIAPPESFWVDRANLLLPGVAQSAEEWGRSLGRLLVRRAA